MNTLISCVLLAITTQAADSEPAAALRGLAPDDGSHCATLQPGVPGPNARFARWTDIDYTGPSVTSHCGQRYNVFVPDGEAPAEGWPVLVFLDNSGFRMSRRMEFIDIDNPAHKRAALAYEALTDEVMPMVVVFASCTVARGGASGNAVHDDHYDPWDAPPAFGAAYPGNGVFMPPGLPDFYTGSVPPYEDPARPMPEKDAVMLVQHVKHNAGWLPPGTTGGIRVDTSRMAVYGGSAAATIGMWSVLGPDRAAQTFPDPVPGSQELEDTRVPAAILPGGVVYWPRFVLDVPLNGLATGTHFPVTSTGAPSAYDEPAELLGDVSVDLLEASSPLRYADDGAGGPVSWLNAQQHLLTSYTEPSSIPGDLCFDKSPQQASLGACWFERDVEQNRHASWSGHALKMRFPNTYLMTTQDAAYTRLGIPVTPQNIVNALPDRITFIDDFANEQMDWLRPLFVGPKGRWSDVGGGLAGAGGTPQLEGAGLIKPDTPLALMLSQAAAGSAVLLVVGSEAVYLPFLGGTLVPAPDLITLGVPPTDANGRLAVSTLMPSTPAVGSTWFQFWIADPTAPAGLSASNAVIAVAP